MVRVGWEKEGTEAGAAERPHLYLTAPEWPSEATPSDTPSNRVTVLILPR